MSTQTIPQTEFETWTIDPVHSRVEFGVRHMMISTVKGTFSELEGTIHLDGDDLSRSSVEVEIDATSLDTGSEDRDQHLRSADFFHVEKHPTLRFVGRTVEPADDGFLITGDLTIRGETREVTLEAEKLGTGTDPWGNPRVGFRAETSISRKDFGLTWNQALETGGVLVGDNVDISLDVQAIPDSDGDEES